MPLANDQLRVLADVLDGVFSAVPDNDVQPPTMSRRYVVTAVLRSGDLSAIIRHHTTDLDHANFIANAFHPHLVAEIHIAEVVENVVVKSIRV